MFEKNSESSESLNRVSEIKEYIPEGATYIFEAPQRFGKTLAMVLWALDSFQHGRKIFSTIQLGFPHDPLEFVDIKLETGASKFWNGHVCIDELNFFYDARRSLSGSNVEFGAYLLQQKKQGCNLTGTTHSLDYLDLRLRQNFDYLIRPKVFPAFPKPPQSLKMEISNGPLQAPKHKTFTIPNVRPFLGLYDTLATYDPFKKAPKEERIRNRSRVEDL